MSELSSANCSDKSSISQPGGQVTTVEEFFTFEFPQWCLARIPHLPAVGDRNLFQMLSGSGTGHKNLRVFGRTLERDGRLRARHLAEF